MVHFITSTTLLLFVTTTYALPLEEIGAHESDKLEMFQRRVALNKPHHVELEELSASIDHTSGKLRMRGNQPCECAAFDNSWATPKHEHNKCVFIDLGAAGGDTFKSFLADGYGKVANCPNGDWEAHLVEANPQFRAQLEEVASKYPGKVFTYAGSAAYMCEGNTTFFVDTDSAHNYWGSSMDGSYHDASTWQKPDEMPSATRTKSDLTAVTVPTVNVMRLIYENSKPEDYVLVKMDIEGAEWDVVPCLVGSKTVESMDALYVEKHPASWQLGNTTPDILKFAEETLHRRGVHIPEYYTKTL